MRIKNKNDIFAYFEIIQELEPKTILDAGMFLKRIGSVTRQIMNQEVPQEICLNGIDFFPEISFAVWDNIYDRIYTWQDFLDECKGNQYELGIILGSDALLERIDIAELFQVMGDCCGYFLLDYLAVKNIKDIESFRVREIKIEGDVYYFIDRKR